MQPLAAETRGEAGISAAAGDNSALLDAMAESMQTRREAFFLIELTAMAQKISCSEEGEGRQSTAPWEV